MPTIMNPSPAERRRRQLARRWLTMLQSKLSLSVRPCLWPRKSGIDREACEAVLACQYTPRTLNTECKLLALKCSMQQPKWGKNGVNPFYVETQEATTTTDRVCSRRKECAVDEYQHKPGTGTQERECRPLMSCLNADNLYAPQTPAFGAVGKCVVTASVSPTDVPCTGKNEKDCSDAPACTFVPGSNPPVDAYVFANNALEGFQKTMFTANRMCRPLTVCACDEYEGHATDTEHGSIMLATDEVLRRPIREQAPHEGRVVSCRLQGCDEGCCHNRYLG